MTAATPHDSPTAQTLRAALPDVLRQFRAEGRFREGGPLGNGHIHDTFSVTVDAAAGSRRYVLQHINTRVFPKPLDVMANIVRVTRHLGAKLGDAKGGFRAMVVIETREGATWFRDAQGQYWRCYDFVEGTHPYTEGEDDPRRHGYEAARAFGRFQQLLADLPAPPLLETIPGFHDTPARFRALERAADADAAHRAIEAGDELDFARQRQPLTRALDDPFRRGEVPLRIVHNDTKLNNVLFDNQTGAGACVIDLDTVMPGLALHDFGDMCRFGTNTAREDEDADRVRVNLEVFEALVRGYLESVGGMLNAAERRLLVASTRVITFEIGVRFLTDYLNGDIYFKIKRPRHNLDRARNQFALLASMERAEARMEKIAAAASS